MDLRIGGGGMDHLKVLLTSGLCLIAVMTGTVIAGLLVLTLALFGRGGGRGRGLVRRGGIGIDVREIRGGMIGVGLERDGREARRHMKTGRRGDVWIRDYN
jgi:hypothetical protein